MTGPRRAGAERLPFRHTAPATTRELAPDDAGDPGAAAGPVASVVVAEFGAVVAVSFIGGSEYPHL
ncbi:hypothetical protein [Streptomyces nitrosporeus]|uniref:hypothetical protein n=1 Tax=Streptomyces nitrosporeus TaxID=28894 RepID=UPI0039A1D09F